MSDEKFQKFRADTAVKNSAHPPPTKTKKRTKHIDINHGQEQRQGTIRKDHPLIHRDAYFFSSSIRVTFTILSP
jgi:hypothetical protein